MDVYLWWIGAEAPDHELLGALRGRAEDVFQVTARAWLARDRPGDSYDVRRQQYSSTRILKWLLERQPAHAGRVLGITDVDLFIPILTFVYGEAQLGGTAAVVSTARLRPDDGLYVDHRLLVRRAVKEAVHELGHTFGLIHCVHKTCVMARSVNLVHVDAKIDTLCHDCQIRYGELRRQGHQHHE